MSICSATKQDGNPCSYKAKYVVGDRPYCGIHVRSQLASAGAQPAVAEAQPVAAPVVLSDVVRFYSTMSDKTYYAFSNFFPARTQWNGLTGDTTEHLFQAAKFDYAIGDKELDDTLNAHRDAILKARTPTLAKSLGRSREVPIRPDWEQKKIEIMRGIVEAKVRQHPEIQQLLLSTGDAHLEEAAPRDFFWGVGHSGKGRNELGKTLEHIRNKLHVEEGG